MHRRAKYIPYSTGSGWVILSYIFIFVCTYSYIQSTAVQHTYHLCLFCQLTNRCKQFALSKKLMIWTFTNFSFIHFGCVVIWVSFAYFSFFIFIYSNLFLICSILCFVRFLFYFLDDVGDQQICFSFSFASLILNMNWRLNVTLIVVI